MITWARDGEMKKEIKIPTQLRRQGFDLFGRVLVEKGELQGLELDMSTTHHQPPLGLSLPACAQRGACLLAS